MPKDKNEKAKTKTNQPAKKSRELAVDIDRAQDAREPLSIDGMVQGAGDADEESLEVESLLDHSVADLELAMPVHHHVTATKPRRWFSRNGGKAVEIKVKAMVLNHTPRYLDCDAELPLKDLQAAEIYPARFRNSWLYPVLIDREGKYHNWPRQQNVALNTSAYILWLARNWPEHKILNKTERNWWQKATGYGIVAVVILIIIVIFMLMFFSITG